MKIIVTIYGLYKKIYIKIIIDKKVTESEMFNIISFYKISE